MFSALALLMLAAPPLAAQTFIGSARQGPEGSWSATPFYRQVEDQKLVFGVPGAPGTDTEVPGNVDGGWSGLKLGSQPFDNVQYFVTAAGGRYGLDVASVTVTNALRGDRVGWELGAGAKAVLVPETPVTPAVALTLALSRTAVEFNAMRQAGTLQAVEQRLTLDRFEAALAGSKRFGKIEPYGGLVWSKVRSKLKDLAAGGRNGADRDQTRVVLGTRVAVFAQEALVVEARIAGGLTWQAGWEVRFK